MTYDHLIDRIDELKRERDESLAKITALTGERDAALLRVTELEAQFQADGNRVSHLQMQLTQALAANEKLTAERDEALRERDDLRHRLDTMAATMFPIEPAKNLRHPQLLDPPSICPSCKNKSWERYTPDDAEPEYHCGTCGWPTKGDA